MSIVKTIRWSPIAILCGVLWSGAAAQSPVPPPSTPQPAPSPAPKKLVRTPRTPPPRVVVENMVEAPQVVTILHQLNGLKMIRLLLNAKQLEAISRLDEDFKIVGEVHTNVIAGLALDDGRTIAAWLPEIRAEMPAVGYRAPRSPVPPAATEPPSQPSVPTPSMLPGVGAPFVNNWFQPADLKIVTRDGKKVLGHYVGVDGLTGLSVITLANGSFSKKTDPETSFSHTSDSDEAAVKAGQHLRLIGPEPMTPPDASGGASTYVRIGERDAIVVSVKRSPSGHLSKVRVRSSKLSPVNIGGIAITESGETFGIIDQVLNNEATIVPIALIRSAAKRVVDRQSSVPRPWLGIRGEPVEQLTLDRILRQGWQVDRARALAEKGRGIFLTSVVPGSPAAQANLKPGDVILGVNDGEVKNAEDFTWILQEAGPGESLNFRVSRPGKPVDEAMMIELGESPDPLFGLKSLQNKTQRFVAPSSLMAQGIEAIPIRRRVASRLGADSGLLVLYVLPESAGFKAGLKPGDVIESIEGQQVLSASMPMALLATPGASCTLEVVRNKEKLTVTIETAKKIK